MPPRRPTPPASEEIENAKDAVWSNREVWTVLSWVVCLAPLVFLARLHSIWTIDWVNHTWVAGYFGEYLRVHWATPIVLNANHMVGMPQPIFYGYLFYPISWLP